MLALLNVNGSSALHNSVRAHRGGLLCVSGGQLVVHHEGRQHPPTLLRAHDSAITAFDASPNGEYAATGQAGLNANVIIWSLRSMKPLCSFQELDNEVTTLAFSLDSRLLLAVGCCQGHSKLFVLDASSGRIVSGSSMEQRRVTAAGFAPAGRGGYVFATAQEGGEIVLWSLDPYVSNKMEPRKVTMGSVQRLFYSSLIFSTSDGGAWLYAGSSAGDILTINVTRAATQLVHPATRHGVGSMIMSSSGQLLVGGGDGSITLFSNDHMWQNTQPFCRVPGSITSLSSTPNGDALIVGTRECAVYRVASGNFAVHSLQQGHAGPLTSIACGAGAPGLGQFAATSCLDGGVRVYDLQSGVLASAANAGPGAGGCRCLDIANTAELTLVTGWGDGSLRGYRHPAGKPPGGPLAPLWTLPGAHTMPSAQGVSALCMSNGGHLIVSGGEAGEVRVWDAATREMVQQFKQHTMRVNCLSVLLDDAHGIMCGEDCSVKASDLSRGASRAQWQLAAPPKALAVGQDQVTFVTGGKERGISVWDLRVPGPVRALPNAHAREVGSLAMAQGASGAPLLASGGDDGIVKVWDFRSGSPLAASAAHTDLVTSLAWAPGCASLVSGSRDGCMATWQVGR